MAFPAKARVALYVPSPAFFHVIGSEVEGLTIIFLKEGNREGGVCVCERHCEKGSATEAIARLKEEIASSDFTKPKSSSQ